MYLGKYIFIKAGRGHSVGITRTFPKLKWLQLVLAVIFSARMRKKRLENLLKM